MKHTKKVDACHRGGGGHFQHLLLLLGLRFKWNTPKNTVMQYSGLLKITM
jgi:hypothetical protein